MSSSDSEDPDNVEVPGGGKDLASLVHKRKLVNENVLSNLSKVSVLTTSWKSVGDVTNTPVNNEYYLMPNTNFPIDYRNALIVEKLSRSGNQNVSSFSSKKYFISLTDQKNINNSLANHNLLGLNTSQQISHPLEVDSSSYEIDNNDEEGMGVAETYETYMPSKLKIGRKHPEPVVESTSLSSVPPVDVWYKLKIPEESIKSGALSALQLESITYACQQHERKLQGGSRGGFLIGDGAGVGKGRTIAGIIFENYLRGRKKALWVSLITDLKVDAERDLHDIGATKISVYSLNKFKYSKLSSEENGKINKGVVFCTYSSIIAKSSLKTSEFESRFKQLIQWCGSDFDGVLVFDECHKAKNISLRDSSKSSKTGLAVLELQKNLPNARVVYASATGATEPKDMAYMVRLGIWGKGTPYGDFNEFHSVLNKRGVGVMEMVAMDMKLRGLYIARQLSFHGVTFRVIEVPLSDEFRKIYNECTALWAETMTKFREAITMLNVSNKTAWIIWSQFWASHQRFFKYMCISAKVKKTVITAREAIKCGKCVVIGLQSTGEAGTLKEVYSKEDADLNDFVSTTQGVLQSLVEKHFPTHEASAVQCSTHSNSASKSKRDKTNCKKPKLLLNVSNPDEYESDSSSSSSGRESSCESTKLSTFNYERELSVSGMKYDLLRKIETLGKKLPANALDELIDELGGPENVAEMTGRKGRIVHNDGMFRYEIRSNIDSSLEMMNLSEKKKFMDGEKDVAIISEAASSGISLHSDRRAINKRCRVHITLELPWSADKAIQQFGRTHRSNQVNAPEYILLISDLGGERRFASVVAKRLESLGALTHGDRRATDARNLSKFNIDNHYGYLAVERTLKSFVTGESMVPPPTSYTGDFMKEAKQGLTTVGLLSTTGSGIGLYESEKKLLGKFLNRILGLPVDLQNALFEYFTDMMEAVIESAKRSGHYDLGILDIATSDQNLKRLSVLRFTKEQGNDLGTTELHRVEAERGMTWEEAEKVWREVSHSSRNFYLSKFKNNNYEVILAIKEEEKYMDEEHYVIFRPNVGRQVRKEPKSTISRKFRPANNSEVKIHWERRYEASKEICSHKYRTGVCKKNSLRSLCDVGLRRKNYHILSGSVLSVWNMIESIVSKSNSLQMVRVKTTDGGKIVGTLIPAPCVPHLIEALKTGSDKVIKQNY